MPTNPQLSVEECAREFVESRLVPPLLHGDEKHQEWLRGELRKWIPDLESLIRRVLPQWVSVEERLPKVGEGVLFWAVPDSGGAGIEHGWLMEENDGKLWCSERTDGYDMPIEYARDQVTHWQPLPSAPKEVGRG